MTSAGDRLVKRSNKSGRWNQSADSMEKTPIFQDKFHNFSNDWTLQIAKDCPSSLKEWEYLLEERLSMANKCKECNAVWVTDNGLVSFYYWINNGSTNENRHGKVLVWLKPQSCPNRENCNSSNVPLMDVYLDELDAVLSYLMMDVGWQCYRRHYPKKDEDEIESRRILRGKKSTKTKGKKQVAKSSDCFQAANAASLVTRPRELNAEIVVKKGVPKTRSRTIKVAESTEQHNAKLKYQFETTHKHIKEQWQLSFRSKFDRFTEKRPLDKWKISLEKVSSDHPLRRDGKWEHFLKERVVAGFKCEECCSFWVSHRSWIRFWIWRNPSNSKGERICEVIVHLPGQKCNRCNSSIGKPKHSVSDNTEEKEIETKEIKKQGKPLHVTGDLQCEEIDAVLDFLYMEIDYVFYHNKTYTDLDEKAIQIRRNIQKPLYGFGRSVHEKQVCQADNNVCNKTPKDDAQPTPAIKPLFQPVKNIL